MWPLRPTDTLLDCGAGTGRFAQEMESHCRVLVLDDHEESLRLLRTRFKPEQILSLSGDTVPLPDGSLEYVTALDVLEHVPDDAAVVRGFHRLLKPGGIAAVTVPASMALWSDWDVGLHHYRRYHRAQLRALFPDEGVGSHLRQLYRNVLVYPAVWLVRKWRAFRPRARPRRGRRPHRGPVATALVEFAAAVRLCRDGPLARALSLRREPAARRAAARRLRPQPHQRQFIPGGVAHDEWGLRGTENRRCPSRLK